MAKGDKKTAAPTPDVIDSSILAEMYGYASNQIDAVPELRDIYDKAVELGWFETDLGLQRFQLEIKNSNWYRENSKYARESFMLKQEGGSAWQNAMDNARIAVEALAVEIGAELTDDELNRKAEQYLFEGWGKDNRQILAQRDLVKYARSGRGAAASYVDQLKSLAFQNGVKFNQGWFDSSARSVLSGLSTIEDKQREIRQAAASRYPALRQQLDSGYTVMDVASPYMSILADELEINPQMITLDDPFLQRALGGFSQDGQPALMNLYDFYRNVRNDPRWLNTRKATNEVAGIATGVLEMFGLRG